MSGPCTLSGFGTLPDHGAPADGTGCRYIFVKFCFCFQNQDFHRQAAFNVWFAARVPVIARRAAYEGCYASVVHSWFTAQRFDIVAEDGGNWGRADMTVRFDGQIYLFEFKMVEKEPDRRAQAQLSKRNYAAKYRGKPIYLIGVEFSRAERNVAAFAANPADAQRGCRIRTRPLGAASSFG